MSDENFFDKPPVTPVFLNTMEIGWLVQSIWKDAAANAPLSRALYLKLKAAAIELDVNWYYGDPWPVGWPVGDKG